MKALRGCVALMFVAGLVFNRPLFVFAEEITGKDSIPPIGESGEGPVSEADEVSILTEAASALDMTHPELAAKLRALAANEAAGQDEKDEPLPAVS